MTTVTVRDGVMSWLGPSPQLNGLRMCVKCRFISLVHNHVLLPPRSGKSTLLHAIAGKVKGDKKISLSGHRYVNGVPISGDSHIPSAFVPQEVNFFPHMTVRETLSFQVELKMGSTLENEERTRLVEDLMRQLGLTKSADTIVGNAKVRGLSGGERKRLSIACEMIASPPIVILGESV